MLAQPCAVARGELRVARQIRVQYRIQVQRPAVVVVEGPPVPVGVPALAAVPDLQQVQGTLPCPCRFGVAPADGLQETGDGVGEQVPVVGGGCVAQGAAQPLLRPVLGSRVEPVPQPRPGQPQPDRHGRGLDHRLAEDRVVENQRPGLGVVAPRRTRTGTEAVGVPLQPVVRILAFRPGDPERGGQERTGIALQAVGAHTGAGRAPRQVEQGPAGGGPLPGGVQQAVGRRFPVRPGVAGVRARPAVLGGEFEGVRGRGGGHARKASLSRRTGWANPSPAAQRATSPTARSASRRSSLPWEPAR